MISESGGKICRFQFWEVFVLKVQDRMAKKTVSVSEDEAVSVAARLIARHNVGSLPVCRRDGGLSGIVTDRDIVLRCVAAGEAPENTAVRSIMTSKVTSISPEEDLRTAADIMAREQVRRLPVTQQGRLIGMLSLGDLAESADYSMEAAAALSEISQNVKKR